MHAQKSSGLRSRLLPLFGVLVFCSILAVPLVEVEGAVPRHSIVSPAATQANVTTNNQPSTPLPYYPNLSKEPTGVIIPVYTQPFFAELDIYNQAIKVKTAYPSVPMIIVIDPANGPGTYSSDMASAVHDMQASGITVLGYATTSWGTRSIASIKGDILTYAQWYHVSGIFLDEMPNWNYNSPTGAWYYSGPGGEYLPAYFSTLTSYAKSLGMTKVTGNSGADVPADFVGSVDTIGIWENTYLPAVDGSCGWTSLAGVNCWHLSYDKSNFMFFAYDVHSLDSQYVLAAANYAAYLYITDQSWPAPYGALTSYITQLVSLLAPIDQGVITSQRLTIISEDANGQAIAGYYTTLYDSGGNTIADGFTPATFALESGASYTVRVSDHAQCHFDHWADTGSASATRSISITGTKEITAIYNCGSTSGGGNVSKVNVLTITSAGSTLAGYYVTLWQNSVQISSCYSPCSFTVNNGQVYHVMAASYGSETFSHWQKDGSTGAERINLPSTSTTISLTAVYSP